MIVTSNLKDFPSSELDKYAVEAQSPDTFVGYLVSLGPARVLEVIQEQAAALSNPSQSVDDILSTLRNEGLMKSVAALDALRAV